MAIKSKMLFVLIGDDRTGKTTLQKLLIDKLCQTGWYEKLKTDLKFEIKHPEIKRKYKTISFANRSYQEKKDGYYKTIENYFLNSFNDSDIAFVSSHLVESDIQEIIQQGRMRFFNIIGVFWSNSISHNQVNNSQISLLEWNERLVIENPVTENAEQIDKQLNDIADNFVVFISSRTSIS